MGCCVRYGDGKSDRVDLGPHLWIWKAYQELVAALEGGGAAPDEFDVLTTVPDRAKGRVTREWMRQAVEQGRRFSKEYAGNGSRQVLWVVAGTICQFEEAIRRPDAAKKPAATKKPAKKKPTEGA